MMRVANIVTFAGGAIYTAAALYSLSTSGAPQCPEPSPRSIEALFAPCLAGMSSPVAVPAPDPAPMLPDPTAPAPHTPHDNSLAVARSGEDVETTGSVP